MEANTPLPCWCAYQRFKKSWLPQRRLEDLWPPSVEPASKLSCLGFTFSRHSCLQHRLQPLMQKFSVNPDVYFLWRVLKFHILKPHHPRHTSVFCSMSLFFLRCDPFFPTEFSLPKIWEAPFSTFFNQMSVTISSLPFSIHFLWYWQGEFV